METAGPRTGQAVKAVLIGAAILLAGGFLLSLALWGFGIVLVPGTLVFLVLYLFLWRRRTRSGPGEGRKEGA